MFGPVAETAYGKVRGVKTGTCRVFKGIPYAKPPVGPLRFRPPEEPEPWHGIRNAAEFGPAALQSRAGSWDPDAAMSEDCLYLNVWSPKEDGALKPVMVWIHGGGFHFGSGSDVMYDGTPFAEKGVVLVTLNYRLGAFGFLYLDEVSGHEYERSGNLGLLDQTAALKWVRKNIKAFGGDPDKVTVFGESAGAISIGNLLAMPDAKGLFRQAILESATDLAVSPELAGRSTKKLLDHLGLRTHEFKKLADMPAKTLLEASSAFPMMTFCPVVDGVSIPERPDIAFSKGSAKDIPVLMGSNKDEFRLFASMNPSYGEWDEKEIEKRLERWFGAVWPEVLRWFKNEKTDKDLFIRLTSYYLFIYPGIKYAEVLSRKAPVWVYSFRFESPALGACHGYDLPFVWHRLDMPGLFGIESPEGVRLADRMHLAWIAFAKNGDPNIQDLPEWPRFSLENREVMVLDAECEVKADPYPDREKWERVAETEAYAALRKNGVQADDSAEFTSGFKHEEEDESAPVEMQFKKGYYSVKDKISDIMKNPEGAKVLTETVGKYAGGPQEAKLSDGMMKMVQNMSVEAVSKMAGKRFPKSALYELNEKLGTIKK
jgi:para-nitrobenzyl esterase